MQERKKRGEKTRATRRRCAKEGVRSRRWVRREKPGLYFRTRRRSTTVCGNYELSSRAHYHTAAERLITTECRNCGTQIKYARKYASECVGVDARAPESSASTSGSRSSKRLIEPILIARTRVGRLSDVIGRIACAVTSEFKVTLKRHGALEGEQRTTTRRDESPIARSDDLIKSERRDIQIYSVRSRRFFLGKKREGKKVREASIANIAGDFTRIVRAAVPR